MKNLRRITIIIYNSYDKTKWHEAHKRAIARAAPICYAFNCNLAIMDFPCSLEDINNIETTIGDSGKYLRELINNNRFFVIDKYQVQFGTSIATTSKPQQKKLITPKKTVENLLKKPCGIYVGLGRHGLPKNILSNCEYHLDITEKEVSLETCTAISSIPAVLDTYSKFI